MCVNGGNLKVRPKGIRIPINPGRWLCFISVCFRNISVHGLERTFASAFYCRICAKKRQMSLIVSSLKNAQLKNYMHKYSCSPNVIDKYIDNDDNYEENCYVDAHNTETEKENTKSVVSFKKKKE